MKLITYSTHCSIGGSIPPRLQDFVEAVLLLQYLLHDTRNSLYAFPNEHLASLDRSRVALQHSRENLQPRLQV